MRAATGGSSSFTWRAKGQADFIAENVTSFDWPTTADWKEVTVALPLTSSLVHLRINPGKEVDGLEIQSIALRGKDGESKIWKFDSAKPEKE